MLGVHSSSDQEFIYLKSTTSNIKVTRNAFYDERKKVTSYSLSQLIQIRGMGGNIMVGDENTQNALDSSKATLTNNNHIEKESISILFQLCVNSQCL